MILSLALGKTDANHQQVHGETVLNRGTFLSLRYLLAIVVSLGVLVSEMPTLFGSDLNTIRLDKKEVEIDISGAVESVPITTSLKLEAVDKVDWKKIHFKTTCGCVSAKITDEDFASANDATCMATLSLRPKTENLDQVVEILYVETSGVLRLKNLVVRARVTPAIKVDNAMLFASEVLSKGATTSLIAPKDIAILSVKANVGLPIEATVIVADDEGSAEIIWKSKELADAQEILVEVTFQIRGELKERKTTRAVQLRDEGRIEVTPASIRLWEDSERLRAKFVLKDNRARSERGKLLFEIRSKTSSFVVEDGRDLHLRVGENGLCIGSLSIASEKLPIEELELIVRDNQGQSVAHAVLLRDR